LCSDRLRAACRPLGQAAGTISIHPNEPRYAALAASSPSSDGVGS
jgi:hypothetical protein